MADNKTLANERRMAAESRRTRNTHPPGSGPEAGRQSRIARDRQEARDRVNRQGPLAGHRTIVDISQD